MTLKFSRTRRNSDEGNLTAIERRFATEYLVDFNAAAAYRRATRGKATPNTAKASGHMLLHRAEVQAVIRAERDRLLAVAQLSAQEVLIKLKHCLMYDPRRIFDTKGALLPMEQWPDDVAAAVVGVEDTMAGRKVKFADKVAALDKAMRYFGLFEKDNRQQAEAFAEVVFKVVKADGKA